jgi:hypothetical protein
MACEMPRESLIDLLSGELSEEEAVIVEQHLADCAPCRQEMEALGALTSPFVSEEPWQPDAAMADRVLARAKARGWMPSPARQPAATVSTAPSGPAAAASQSVSPAIGTQVHPVSTSNSLFTLMLAWVRRPLPSYAAATLAIVALAAGLWLGGGAWRPVGRFVPAGTARQAPPAPSPSPERSGPSGPERSAGLQANEDSVLRASTGTRGARHGRVQAGTQAGSRPIAFVAVYTDAMRLTTPGVRDSF